MDGSEQFAREDSEDISCLAENSLRNFEDGDSSANSDHLLQKTNHKIPTCEIDVSHETIDTIDEVPTPATGFTTNETFLRNSENLGAQETYTVIRPTGSESPSPPPQSQAVVNANMSSEEATSPQTGDKSSAITDFNEEFAIFNEPTEKLNQPTNAQTIDASISLDFQSVNEDKELLKSQEKGPRNDEDEAEFESPTNNEDLLVETTDRSVHYDNDEKEDNMMTEAGCTQSCETKGSEQIRVVQMAMEEELKVEELTVPPETMLRNEGEVFVEVLPSISVEERSLSKASADKVCAQFVHEIVESVSPVSIDNHEEGTCNSTQAKAIHQATELQTAIIQTEAVQFSPLESGVDKSTVDHIDQAPLSEFALTRVQSTELLELMPEVELEKGDFIEMPQAHTATINLSEIKRSYEENRNNSANGLVEQLSSSIFTKSSGSIGDGKEKTIPMCAKASGHDASLINRNAYAANESEPNIADEELDFDTKYALFVGKVLPGHEIYYLPPANLMKNTKKQVLFRRGGTLDQRRTDYGSPPYFDTTVNLMRTRSATLGTARRRGLQPKPALNDDYLFPDSVTPSKVEKTISVDDNNAFNADRCRYDVPFMDDDAFVRKKYRNFVVVDDDSSSNYDYSDEGEDLQGPKQSAKMDETSPHRGLTPIDGKLNITHESGSRWTLGLSICGCLRRRR